MASNSPSVMTIALSFLLREVKPNNPLRSEPDGMNFYLCLFSVPIARTFILTISNSSFSMILASSGTDDG